MNKELVIASLNILAAGAPLVAAHAHATTAPDQVTVVNAATLSAIEKSWLEVPFLCKARVMNASPVVLENQMASHSALSVYASFGA